MARKREGPIKRFYKKNLNPKLDEVGLVASAFGGYGLAGTYGDFFKEVKRGYLQNVSAATRKKARKMSLSRQMKFPKFHAEMKKVDRVNRVIERNLLTKEEAKRIRSRINYNFREPQVSKFAFFKRAKHSYRAVKNPYYSSAKQKIVPDEAYPYLKKANRKAIFRALRRVSLPALGYAGVTFLAVPSARAFQAKYAKRRKFDKEFRRGVSRGVLSPIQGYLKGAALDEELAKRPWLRASKTIRAKEGRYHQMYGQGVQFYKGTSGMRASEIRVLDRDMARMRELRRRAKRRRGK